MQDTPTEDQKQLVKQMIATGFLHDDIARHLEISPEELAEYFQEELNHAALDANNQVLGTLFQMATNGKHPAVTMFWAKVRCGWGLAPIGKKAATTETTDPEDDPRKDPFDFFINDEAPNIVS